MFLMSKRAVRSEGEIQIEYPHSNIYNSINRYCCQVLPPVPILQSSFLAVYKPLLLIHNQDTILVCSQKKVVVASNIVHAHHQNLVAISVPQRQFSPDRS